MLTKLVRFSVLFTLVAGLVCAPARLSAQSTNKSVDKKEAAAKKPSSGPFHGKLSAIDKSARTITVGKRTFQVTSDTKIKRADKPASLNDAIVGEEISGYIRPTDEGKLVATTVNLGPKNQPGNGKKAEK
jgi:hypothetical protein